MKKGPVGIFYIGGNHPSCVVDDGVEFAESAGFGGVPGVR